MRRLQIRTVKARICALVIAIAVILPIGFVGCASKSGTESVEIGVVRSAGAASAESADDGISMQAEQTYTLAATVKPDNATNKGVIWTCFWTKTTTSDISQYIQLTTDGNKATVTCLKAFVLQICVRAASEENSEIYAECLVDYARVPIEYNNVSLGVRTISSSGLVRVTPAMSNRGTVGEFTPYIVSGDGGTGEVSYIYPSPRSGAPGILEWEKATYYADKPWFNAIPNNTLWWTDYYSPDEDGDLYELTNGSFYNDYFSFIVLKRNARYYFDLFIKNLDFWDRFPCELSYYTDNYGNSEGGSPHLKEYVKAHGVILNIILYYDYTSPNGTTERKKLHCYVELDNADIK